jgi:hypothetical protein
VKFRVLPRPPRIILVSRKFYIKVFKFSGEEIVKPLCAEWDGSRFVICLRKIESVRFTQGAPILGCYENKNY